MDRLGSLSSGLEIFIHPEVIEEELLREPIHPVLFGDLLTFAPLAGSRRHAFDLGHGGLADGGVFGGVFGDDGFHQVGAFEDDAATDLE